MSILRNRWDALQGTLTQSTETITRKARVGFTGGEVDKLDAPEEIDEYVQQAKQTALVRANLRQFVQDVTEPGYRLEGPDETVAYFLGEDDEIDATPPSDTPEGGFLENSFVIGGEKRRDFYFGLQQTIWERWVRGTVLVEYLKKDKEDADSEIHGFHFIRPETVYPQVEKNKNILIGPEDTDKSGVTITPRDEAAAYVQFDDQSILGRRNNGYDKDAVPLSQNDILKQTLEPDIGGDVDPEDGIFGTSAMEAIADDVEEYNDTKRDRHRAIKSKAWGIYSAQFTPETLELGNGQVEVIEWDDKSIKETERELKNLGPGSLVTSDAPIDLNRYDSEVPDLDDTLNHYVDDIVTALPAPKYLTGFGEDITQYVTEHQESGYHDTISEERQYQERSWTQAFKEVAERKGLPTDGLRLRIEAEEDESPIMSLDDETVSMIDTYADAVNKIEMATTLTEEEKRELILQLPGTPELGSLEEPELDESDPQVQEQAGNLEQAMADGGDDEEETEDGDE